MVKVVVVKADTYDEQVVELAMKELFDELGGYNLKILSLRIMGQGTCPYVPYRAVLPLK